MKKISLYYLNLKSGIKFGCCCYHLNLKIKKKKNLKFVLFNSVHIFNSFKLNIFFNSKFANYIIVSCKYMDEKKKIPIIKSR